MRVDTWVETGTEITPFYDSLIAKFMVYGSDRPDAVAKLVAALGDAKVMGIPTNLELLRTVAASEAFASGMFLLSRHERNVFLGFQWLLPVDI